MSFSTVLVGAVDTVDASTSTSFVKQRESIDVQDKGDLGHVIYRHSGVDEDDEGEIVKIDEVSGTVQCVTLYFFHENNKNDDATHSVLVNILALEQYTYTLFCDSFSLFLSYSNVSYSSLFINASLWSIGGSPVPYQDQRAG